jgi:RHS repeat-associated protein
VARETRGAHGVDYVRGLQLIRQADSGGVQIYPLHGHLATSLGAVDAHGNIIEQVEADAFGVLQQGALKQTHLYSGEYVDADTQLVYLRARWYDPRIGRFVSADPFEGRPQDPRSLNRYVYAHNDPVHGTDPSGKFTDWAQFGRDVEAEVKRQYESAFPMHNVSFGKQLRYEGGFWKPDIQNFTLSVYQEIKPLSPSGIAAGIAQMAVYDLAYQCFPLNMNRGNWAPSVYATVDGTPVFFFERAGIIFYTDDKQLAIDAAAFSITSLATFVRMASFKLSSKVVSNLATVGANLAERSAAGLSRQMVGTVVLNRF